MYLKKLRFNNNAKFVIMQVSDAQDLPVVRRSMVRMLNKAYDTIKPDLVVFTGDNILGNHINDAVIGTRQVAFGKEATLLRIERALKHILEPLEKRGIPFAMIFGNHDDMNEIPKPEQLKVYNKYSCFIGYEDACKPPVGTYNIPLYSHDGTKKIFNLWMLDSAGQNKDAGSYTYVKEETVSWLGKESEELKRNNEGIPMPSIVFQHIPLPETLQLLEICNKNLPGAVEHNGAYYRLNPKLAAGILGEYPHVCVKNTGEFEALKRCGGVLAVVSGHDHLNAFEGRLEGIDIIQTPCASFRCYGNSERGIRIFELNEDAPLSYKTKRFTYFDLFGKGPVSELQYIFDADDKEKLKYAICAAAGGLAVALGLTAIIRTQNDDEKHR